MLFVIFRCLYKTPGSTHAFLYHLLLLHIKSIGRSVQFHSIHSHLNDISIIMYSTFNHHVSCDACKKKNNTFSAVKYWTYSIKCIWAQPNFHSNNQGKNPYALRRKIVNYFIFQNEIEPPIVVMKIITLPYNLQYLIHFHQLFVIINSNTCVGSKLYWRQKQISNLTEARADDVKILVHWKNKQFTK